MNNTWTAQVNDLIGGYIVTDYPHPLSQHDERRDGDPEKFGYVIAECMTEKDATTIATLLNAAGIDRPEIPSVEAGSGGAFDFDPPEDWDPVEAIIANCEAKGRGEEVNEGETMTAAAICCAMTLMSHGLSEEQAIKVVDKAMEAGTIRVRYTPADGNLSITIGDDDDEGHITTTFNLQDAEG